MRSPSVQALKAAFHELDTVNARLVKRFAKAADDSEELRRLVEKHSPETQEYVRSMHSDPYRSHMWRVTVALHAIQYLTGGFGVEGLGPQDPHEGYAPPYEYINMGGTYATTLIYNRKSDTLSIGTWGDIAEKHPSWE